MLDENNKNFGTSATEWVVRSPNQHESGLEWFERIRLLGGLRVSGKILVKLKQGVGRGQTTVTTLMEVVLRVMVKMMLRVVVRIMLRVMVKQMKRE